MVSGGLAGLAGMAEVGGVVHRLQDRTSRRATASRASSSPTSPSSTRSAWSSPSIAFGGPDPGRPRDPAGRHPGHDPGHRPVLRHRQRRPAALPRPAGPPVNRRDGCHDDPRGGRRERHDPTVRGHRRDLHRARRRHQPGRRGHDVRGRPGRIHGRSSTTGNPWLGLARGDGRRRAAGLLHAVVSIHFQADQIVSGLALTFLGIGPGARAGRGPRRTAGGTRCCRPSPCPVLSQIPFIGPVFFTDQSVLVYVGYLLVPIAWYWIHRTRPGLHLRAVGEYPTAADALGVNVYRIATATSSSAARWRASPGRPSARHHARLVRRPDRRGRGLDRRRPRHLRALEPIPGADRGLSHRGHPGA